MRRQDLVANELRLAFAKAKLPTNPAVASAIIEHCSNEKSNAADFAKVIRTDAALAIRLLKTANSAHFAQRIQVTTVERAVTVLGLSRVKTAALGFQLLTHVNRLGSVPFDLKTFWQHSLLRGCLGRTVATHVVPERADEAFLIALLQDCGIVMLAQTLGPRMQVCAARISRLRRSLRLNANRFLTRTWTRWGRSPVSGGCPTSLPRP